MTVGNLWQRMRDAVGQLTKRNPSNRRSRDGRRASLFAELLEPRALLSVNQIIFDFVENKVLVQGTADADQVSVVMASASEIRVRAESVDGVVESTFQRSAVSSIVFHGADGNDRFENQTSFPSNAYGEGDADLLIGGSGADYMAGGDGDDELRGGGENDYLLGGAGSDVLTGGDGDDELHGQDGDDWADGGGGNDNMSGSLGNDTLYGGAGDDQLIGNEGNDTLVSNDGNDRLDGSDGSDRLYGGAGSNYLLGGAGSDVLTGGDGDDELHGQDGDDWADGGGGNDNMSGSLGNDTLYGGAGDDQLIGNEGNDTLVSNDGNDRLDGSDGSDRLYGGAGSNYLLGGAGSDVLTGGDGDDELHGQDGDDWADGGGGNDNMSGSLGNDTLYGGAGDDQLIGNEGNDTLVSNDGNDRLDGSDGSDRLYGGAGSNYLLGGAGSDVLTGGDGDDELHGQDGDDWADGGGGNDNMSGSLGNDTLYGGAGDDQLIGNEGNDTLVSNDGNDRLDGSDGSDRLYGGAGSNYLLGGAGSDVLTGGDGDDELHGQDGDDWADGGGGNDNMSGSLGNDTLYGGAGDDQLIGNEGNDTLVSNDGNDRLDGSDGSDRLYGGAGSNYLLGGAGSDVLTGGDGDDELHGQDGDDWADGGGGNDNLTGGSGMNVLLGGAGDDELTGGDAKDTLLGGGGVDYMAGGDGYDDLRGEAGNDYLLGGAGADTLYGGDGNDEVHGQDGNDWADGGAGSDNISGSIGDDTLFGGAGDDILTGDNGNDTLNGGDGNDSLRGMDGNDILIGGSGTDQLLSGLGRNVLAGGADDDDLAGNGESDVLIGGDGVDQLRGEGGEDLLIGGSTSYDANAFQLSVLLSTWTSAAPYASRIAQIESEAFAARLASNVTVFDDGVADAIFGNDGQDWFFMTGFMGVYDPNLAEHGDHDHTAEDDSQGHLHAGPVILDSPPALEGFALIDSLDKLSDRQATESIHSLIPHAADSVLQREHLSLFQLVRYSQVTHHAVVSGAWSDPSTWHDGIVPGDGARVLIPIGLEVTVDGVIPARIGTVRVDGTLSFSTTVTSELRVDTIVVSSVGRFEMGSETTPIPANISARLLFTDNGPIDRVADPFGISRGLISHGSVSMHGAAVTTHSAVNGALLAGTSVLALTSLPTGWKVGDTIVIAGTTSGAAQNEVRTITAIVGSLVFVNQPLSYNHVPFSANLEIHVANTTRNVSIDSESGVVERRGHVMFMHNRDVHIANAGFYQLGRTDKGIPVNDSVVDANWQLAPGTGTNQRGRYSVHFHRNGFINDGNPATISGSAVVDSPGWGYVNHSSYVDMLDNVAYDVHGAAFATEVGDEIGSFVGNIAIGSTGSGEKVESRLFLQDFGHQGDGFWFQGPGITVTGNIAAGNDGNAFIMFARGLIEGGVRQRFLSANLPDPSIAGGAVEIDVEHVPIFRFDNNVGYASGMGLDIWYHLRDAAHDQKGVFEDSTFWNNYNGVGMPYTAQTILRDLTIVRVPDFTAGIGVGINSVTQDIVYENLTVTGYYRGVVLPRKGYAIVDGGRYDNYQDVLIETALTADRSVLFTGALQLSSIVMARRFEPMNGSIAHVFLSDHVILDFGLYQNQRLYYLMQAMSAVPFPIAEPSVPAGYIGLTTLELWNQFGVVVGGTAAPAGAFSVPQIVGLVGLPG